MENQRARKLYEEIFDEDTQAFVDYYFRVKAAENEIFVVENEKQEILATLHLIHTRRCSATKSEDQLHRGSGNESRLSSSGHDAFSVTGISSGNVPKRRSIYLADAGGRIHLSSIWFSLYL